MDFMQKTPVLLRIPDFSIKGKENERPSVPLLKVNLSSANKSQETNIFRLPIAYYNPPIILHNENETKHPAHPPIPKLIDIKSVLKSARNKKNNHTVAQNSALYKDVKLIKLPIITTKTCLLDSPKRKMSDVHKHKPVEKEEPQIVDIRPFTPQEPAKLIDTTKIRESKQRNHKSVMASSRNSLIRTSAKSPSHTLNKYIDVQSDESSSIIDERDQRSKRKHRRKKKHAEEELYEVISELLMERRKKKRCKRLKLFDIIDNIPLSSDSEVDDDIPLVGKGRTSGKENRHHLTLLNPTPYIHVSKNTPIITDVRTKKTMLPDIPLDKFKPKSSKFLENCDKNNDPLSWANIIKIARQETQGTQTENKGSNIMKSQEIQTEMREMVDIPRIQTFFKSNYEIDKTVKNTNEFCDRVRKEVVEKLDNIKRKEDKYCQTICDACIQTDEEIQEVPVYLASNFPIKKTSEKLPYEKSHCSVLPPDIHTEVHFDNKMMNTNKDFINIVDLDAPYVAALNSQPLVGVSNVDDKAGKSEFFKLESIDEYIIRITSDNDPEKSKKDAITVDTYDAEEKNEIMQDVDQPTTERSANGDAFEREDNLKINSHILQINSHLSITNNDHVDINAVILDQENRENTVPRGLLSNIIGADGSSDKRVKKRKAVKKSKQMQKESPLQSEVTGKTTLPDNIAEFSVGLDALKDIHDNLEKELKQSKFLFGMIETLQDGFISDGSQEIQASHNISSSTSIDMDSLLPGTRVLKPIDKSEKETPDESYNEKNTESNLETSHVPFDSLEQYSPSHHHDNFGESLGEYVKTDEFLLSARNRTVDRYEDSKNVSPYGKKLGNIVEDNVVESEKDALFKKELQMRICKTMTMEEMKLKREKDKRSKLLKWIQAKKSERQKEYLEDLGQKRGAEHHPFVSKNSVSGKEIKQNISIQAQVTRCLLEENNQERLFTAEKLATAVILKEPSTRKTPGRSPHGVHGNNRYNKTNSLPIRMNKIPIRETRASKIRKTALISDILKNKQLHQNIVKRKRRNKIDNPKKEKKTSKSKKVSGYLRSSSRRGESRYGSLDKSMESFNASGRRSVEAHKFVTEDSYVDYMIKSSKSLQRTIHEYKQLDDSNTMLENVDFHERLTSSRLSNLPSKEKHMHTSNVDFKYDESAMKMSSSFSLNSSADNNEVKNLLKKYGMNVDEGLFEKTSGTSQLLAEVDLALLDESDLTGENSVVSENIDWNEIDKILDE